MNTMNDKYNGSIVSDNASIYHHGIKGMKWGVRRYQTKDGLLTKAGLKRYNKDMDKLHKEEQRLNNQRITKAKLDELQNTKQRIEEKKKELNNKSSNKKDKIEKKSISEMSNEELATYKQRLQNERDIVRFQNEIISMTPKEKSKIEKFTDGVGGMLFKTIWNDVGKGQINKFFEKNLGLEKPLDELGKMKKEAEMWEAKAKIAKNKKLYGDDTEKYENAQRRRDEESKIRKNNKDALNKAEKHAYEENGFRRKAKEEAYAKAKKQVDDYNTAWEQRDGTYRKKGSDLKWNKDPINRDGSDRLRLEQVERYEATGKDVIGKGLSRYTSRDGRPYIDADYRDVVTNYPAVINRGSRSYNNVIAMLEDKRMKHSDDGLEYLIQNGLEKSIDQSLDELYHYGIKGMKWGVHRFYNKDGSRTAAGKKRENEAKRKDRDEVKVDLGDISKTGIFKEALSNFRPKRNSYGNYEPLEVEVNIGKNRDVTVSTDIADYKSNIYDDIPERARKTDEFIKNFDDNTMRKYLVDEYYEHSDKSMTREEFGKQFTLYYIRTTPETDMFEASYYDDGCMYGHSFDIEGSMKDRKPYLSSMNG